MTAEDETESKSDRDVTMKKYSKIRVGETPFYVTEKGGGNPTDRGIRIYTCGT